MPDRINIYFSSRNELEVFSKVKRYADENRISLSKGAFALIEKALTAEDEGKELVGVPEQVKRIEGAFRIMIDKWDPKLRKEVLDFLESKEREKGK